MNIGSKFDIDNPYYDVILWHSFLLSGLVAYPKHLTQNKVFFFKLITCNKRCNAYTVSLEMVERLDVKGPICRISEFQAKIQADSMFLEKSQSDCEFYPYELIICLAHLMLVFFIVRKICFTGCLHV